MKLWHYGYLTADIEASLNSICGFTGAEKPVPMEITFDEGEVKVGTPFTVKCANVEFGGAVYEFVQPVDSPDCFMAKQLAERGNGIHHAAFELGEKYDAEIESLVEKGWTIGAAACKGGNNNCFILSPDGSVCYELIENIPQ